MLVLVKNLEDCAKEIKKNRLKPDPNILMSYILGLLPTALVFGTTSLHDLLSLWWPWPTWPGVASSGKPIFWTPSRGSTTPKPRSRPKWASQGPTESGKRRNWQWKQFKAN